MLYAIRDDGTRSTPTYSGEMGLCPLCLAQVRGKHGEIIRHHWAHLSDDCDRWSEPESDWHLSWKATASANDCAVEVPIALADDRHRADAVRPDGFVVEFQRSSISPEEMREREKFYDRMAWVFDATEAVTAGRLDVQLRYPSGWARFSWRSTRKCLTFVQRPLFIDVGPSVIWILLLKNGATEGFGYLRDKTTLFSKAVWFEPRVDQ